MRGDEPNYEIVPNWNGIRIPHMRGDEPTMFRQQVGFYMRIPHMRGDEPKIRDTRIRKRGVYPTCVGMNLYHSLCPAAPTDVYPTCVGMNRSDRVRLYQYENVYPTCVGMNREPGDPDVTAQCIPHMRGDEPEYDGNAPVIYTYTPHAWG